MNNHKTDNLTERSVCGTHRSTKGKGAELASARSDMMPEEYVQAMDRKCKQFVADMTDLMHKHGLGITGTPEVFILDGWDDRQLEYRLDAESRLTF